MDHNLRLFNAEKENICTSHGPLTGQHLHNSPGNNWWPLYICCTQGKTPREMEEATCTEKPWVSAEPWSAEVCWPWYLAILIKQPNAIFKSVSSPAHKGLNEGQKGKYTQEQPAQMMHASFEQGEACEWVCVSVLVRGMLCYFNELGLHTSLIGWHKKESMTNTSSHTHTQTYTYMRARTHTHTSLFHHAYLFMY